MPQAAATPRSLTERYQAEFPTSRKLHEQAKPLFPHGVTHDLRHLEPFPVYIDRAEGAHKWDVDGHKLIDFWSGHGSLLLGHSHRAVVEAVRRQAGRSTHPGGCHELEIEWGQWVQKLVPSAERMRFTASGTEATLMALRLARIFTGKPRVLKFAGHFHGWHDFVIPAADPPYFAGVRGQGAGVRDQGSGSSESHESDSLTPDSCVLTPVPVPGIPREVQAETVVVPPNDPATVERALASDPDIGCVILEPTGGHFGGVPIRGDFLKALGEITAKHNRLLIFDEVITGFRVSPGGAQGHYGIRPDLTTLAKILAGGLPGGCLAGRADVLASLEIRPGKPKMKHPGTFNANPLSAAAGVATLQLVATGEPCRKANETARLLRRRLNAMLAERGHDWVCYGEFSGFRLLPGYQGPRPTGDDFIPYGGALDRLDRPKDLRLVHAFRRGMLLQGVDLPGLSGMTTAAHTEADVEATVAAVAATLDALAEGLA